jgi:hypothetical protein
MTDWPEWQTQDSHSWRDGVYLSDRGKRHLGNLYARISGLERGGTAEGRQ